MTFFLIICTLILGLPFALMLDREASPGRIAGEAFLLGSGAVAVILVAMSLIGVAWTRPSVLAASLVLFAAGCIPLVRRRERFERAMFLRAEETTEGRVFSVVILIVLLLTVAGHAIYATRAPIPEWDFWAIWGLKGRVFAANQGIDWAYLEDPLHAFIHPEYPLLVPLNYALHTIVRGGWEDRQLGLLTTAFGVATLLIVQDVLRRELPSMAWTAAATLAVAAIALSPWIGMAESPLIAFGAGGLLLVRRGLVAGQAQLITAGSLFLGLAAMTKNEGSTLLLAATIALGVSLGWKDRRTLARLWPAYALALPWWILSRLHNLSSDLTAGLTLSRLMHSASRAGDVLRDVALHTPNRPLFWGAIVIAFLIAGGKVLRRERFILVACGLQICAYITAYLITPHDVDWQVATSWVRLLNQIGVPLACSALIIMANQVSSGSGLTMTSE